MSGTFASISKWAGVPQVRGGMLSGAGRGGSLMPSTDPILLEAPPENLGEFIDGIAVGVGAIHGAAAAAAYRARAVRGFGAAVAAPAAVLWGVEAGVGCAAILMGIQRGDLAEITLVHVLPAFAGKGLEHALVAAAAEGFRKNGARAILSEAMQHVPMDLDGAFDGAGFSMVRRGLFHVPTDALIRTAGTAADASVPLGPGHFAGAGECIAAAYAGHPGRIIHPEVRSAASAQAYLLRVLTGAHGPVLPNHCRVALAGDVAAGVLLGCEIAPQSGFVLQLAVLPEFRGRGMATGLLGAFARACATADVPMVSLGVTLDNPARGLYEKLGFRFQLPVTAYHWQLCDPADLL